MSYLHARPIVTTNVHSAASRDPPVSRRTSARRDSLVHSIASLVGMKNAAPAPPAPPRALHRPVVLGCARKPALKRPSSGSGLPRTDSVDSITSSSSSSSADFDVGVQFYAGNESWGRPTDGEARSALPGKSRSKTSIVRRSIRNVSHFFRGPPPPPPRVIPVLPPPPEMDALSIISVEDAPPPPVSHGARKVRFCVPPPSPPPSDAEDEDEDEEPLWSEFMRSSASAA